MSTEESYLCNVCNLNIRSYNKKRHENSKKHKEKIVIGCTICLENVKLCNFIVCSKCNQQWCKQCDIKIAKCPFCREFLVGKEHVLEEEKRERTLEYERELIEEESERIRRVTFTIPSYIIENENYFQTIADIILMSSLLSNDR